MLTAVEASGDGVVGCVGGYDRLWLTKAENHKLILSTTPERTHWALGSKKCHHFLFSEKIF